MTPQSTFPVVVVTGLSGAGKSTALNVLEDLRFYCADGLPASLLPTLVDLFSSDKSKSYRGLALGIDIRQTDFLREWNSALEKLDTMGASPQLVFLLARPDIIKRRYATTRRLHPLESNTIGLDKAIAMETEMLDSMRDQASLLIDTSDFSIHDLRRVLQSEWLEKGESKSGMRVHLLSFGYKYGVPMEADLVFDLRFLRNPYFEEKLRPLSGKDKSIAKYVLDNQTGKDFLNKLTDFLTFMLPHFLEEGRYRLSIALGCTGGRHRSVAVTEAIYTDLQSKGYEVFIEHKHLSLG